MARKVGDRASEYFGNAHGTIISAEEIPGYPGIFEYGIEWDDGNFLGETYIEDELEPIPEDD